MAQYDNHGFIVGLNKNEYFVFGSNIEGLHLGGAAKQAHEQFSAEWGIGVGMTGQCYAIPTMEGKESFERYVKQFLEVAALMSSKLFILTKVGCGIAGMDEEYVRELFKVVPNNVIKPEDWNE